MRIALAQLNPTVGDIAGNTRRLIDAATAAAKEGAELIVSPELYLIGYPPRDLLLREGVVERCEVAVQEIAKAAPSIGVLVGHPRRAAFGSRPLRNSLTLCRNGRVEAVYDKRLLPTYDVFDEDRYFEPGSGPLVVDVGTTRVGIMICEDLWRADDVTASRRYSSDPMRETARLGCDVVVVPSASPFIVGKRAVHIRQLTELAGAFGVPIVSVNQVGANDDLVFDGASVVVASDGKVIAALTPWREEVRTVDVWAASTLKPPEAPWEEDVFHALVLGIRDYCAKTGNARVLIGLSGGIDSALTATLAVAAVGPKNVRGVTMPSRYSSSGSVDDSRELAKRLGMEQFDVLSIESGHAAVTAALEATEPKATKGVADENAQARLRGLLLMSIANATNALVLATGNKSEMATGYCTLYGDMCGALAVLGDVTKTRVWALSRWINANYARCGFNTAPVPETSIEKVPSAELRPNQTDQDSLPPYDVLDKIVEGAVDLERDAETIAGEHGLDVALVKRWMRVLDMTEYKRAQAALVLKITDRAFGPGRRYPLAMRTSDRGT